ncbi:WGR domain-containing protein [Rhodobacter sphaeroides]|jgi:predicted DNA-binding WGR domain protein|uniref:WGR domain-containing protein n=3 Tax=Cereibacter TaxID=1653176 RepID=Q3IYW3_CERS4|nr:MULTISPECIES: WGR domain-containing protein [Cereibacter]ABN77850.1 WGR domain protein [Cereibacter sphaeroides ATCC 17029]EKX58157.1 hypothetical protein D516_0639 [Rhodobacter sp. AKP1]RDS93743.1 WGR domain-containing protein [Cereibacter sphaeroides f. sp. denitrificans]ABA80271.1 WGR domain-containing protein [Cereibacter sphaeroides 2.4.1]ACM02343.1 WGR domain protein [Cereibacter sphaeroides KD131]
MLTYLCLSDADGPARFYRVELAYNLFGEYTVLREWGRRSPGRAGRRLVTWFSNLRDACLAAERWHQRARRRGYHTTIEGRA